MRQVGVFLDVTNLFYHTNRLMPNSKIDYRKLFEAAQENDIVLRAYAYGSQRKDEAFKFISLLKHLGYETKYKQVKIRGTKIIPVNWNVDMAVDLFRIASKLDRVVFGSNNPELLPLINWAKESGLHVTIIAPLIHRDMREAADATIDISIDMLENRDATTTVPPVGS